MKSSFLLLLLIDLTTKFIAAADNLIRLPIIKHATPHSIAKRDNIPAIPLFNANAREYLIEIGLGSPAQMFNVTLDTGSSDLWVPSSSCPKSTCLYSRFIEKDSSTLNQTKRVFDVQYGSGSAKGLVAYDTVTIGNNLTSANHVIGLANTTSGMSTSSITRVSGILGLGFQGLLRDPAEDTFIQKLLRNQVIKEPVFSIYLNRQADYGYTGEIVIGGYETSRFTGTLNFLPVVNYNKRGQPNLGRVYSSENNDDMMYKYWTVPGQAVASYTSDGSKLYETRFPDVQPAILDTGTTLSYLPQDNVIEILETITKDYAPLKLNGGAVQAYQVNCSDFTTQEMWFDFQFSPSVNTFSNSPVIIRVPLKELVLPQNTDDINTATTCLFGLAPISSGFLSSIGSGWILGQTVLRSAYVVHDMLEYQIGIGAAANGYFSPTMVASLSVTKLAFHHHYCSVFLSLLIIIINSLLV
ncbi:aspartic peptidase domain-containing protein [Mucor lusitanicus]|uniref:rhizopuspepsin n=1 Tax=Mucor circinelloides f. lusitanicus TaxID=29924 RepID=A0A8H4F2S6_MUCCL|nr:aspartic peptidase domain-containing protein [Mucor lusitanicus]